MMTPLKSALLRDSAIECSCTSSLHYDIPKSRDSNVGKNTVTYLLLYIAFSRNNWEVPMEEKLSKVVDPMVLPVIHAGTEIYQGFISQFAINSLVGLLKYPICSFDPRS